MKKIAIIGSGGLGREVLGIVQSINRVKEMWNIVGFYDDSETDGLINGYPILGNINSINDVDQELSVAIGIGNPKVKAFIHSKIKNSKITFPSLIHPSATCYTMETIAIGKGVIIGANCVITVNVTLQDFVYVNTAAIISHDSSIGKYSMIMPSVSISAAATIGEQVYLGNGTLIDYPITIENGAFIKAGSLLTQS